MLPPVDNVPGFELRSPSDVLWRDDALFSQLAWLQTIWGAAEVTWTDVLADNARLREMILAEIDGR